MKVKFLKHNVGRLLKYNIDKLGKFSTCSVNDSIVISGTPRVGSTWLMEILLTLPSYKSVFEPFHKDWFPKVKELSLPPRPYLHPYQNNPQLRNYLENVFRGKIISQIPRYKFKPGNISRRLFAKNVVAKFVRANRLLPWITNNFELKGTFLMIRHPCATILSQLKTGIYGYFYTKTKGAAPTKNMVLREASEIQQIKENKELMRKLDMINSQIEVLAAIWSMDNYIPLYYLKPKDYYLVVYEKLISEYEQEVKKYFEFIGENTPQSVYKMFKKPSMLTMETDKPYVGSSMQLEKWKKEFTDKQITKILKVANWFGLDFYSEEVEPDYGAIKSFIRSEGSPT